MIRAHSQIAGGAHKVGRRCRPPRRLDGNDDNEGTLSRHGQPLDGKPVEWTFYERPPSTSTPIPSVSQLEVHPRESGLFSSESTPSLPFAHHSIDFPTSPVHAPENAVYVPHRPSYPPSHPSPVHELPEHFYNLVTHWIVRVTTPSPGQPTPEFSLTLREVQGRERDTRTRERRAESADTIPGIAQEVEAHIQGLTLKSNGRQSAMMRLFHASLVPSRRASLESWRSRSVASGWMEEGGDVDVCRSDVCERVKSWQRAQQQHQQAEREDRIAGAAFVPHPVAAAGDVHAHSLDIVPHVPCAVVIFAPPTHLRRPPAKLRRASAHRWEPTDLAPFSPLRRSEPTQVLRSSRSVLLLPRSHTAPMLLPPRGTSTSAARPMAKTPHRPSVPQPARSFLRAQSPETAPVSDGSRVGPRELPLSRGKEGQVTFSTPAGEETEAETEAETETETETGNETETDAGNETETEAGMTRMESSIDHSFDHADIHGRFARRTGGVEHWRGRRTSPPACGCMRSTSRSSRAW
ncbi:hypothetical protein FIBSPDRAFT_1053974 [Athelia psychrophila]|uniref:Uncharacterized protein n=1 Tax=Athelia psychrophila TaxID=1759441 RepID=A0A167W3A5_9AGAM|nr:hypothetical protein FIBSPDRAFT_1053974 [Fibularhizoctonia sp. CBS 109695]